jgi:hypothetical protein
MTVNVCSAIVIVSVRIARSLRSTVYFTVPLPVPDAPEVILIQPAFSLAVQLHQLVVVTVTVPMPPASGNVWLSGEMT